MQRSNRKVSKKGTGFKQPKRAHGHWHIDVAYLSIGGTFYYLCSILDGYSHSIVHWAHFPVLLARSDDRAGRGDDPPTGA